MTRQITDVLGADECRFVAGPVHDRRIALLDHDGVLTRGGDIVDADRVGLPRDEYVALLVRRGSRVVGHFLVAATTHVSYPTGSNVGWPSSSPTRWPSRWTRVSTRGRGRPRGPAHAVARSSSPVRRLR